MIALKGVHLGKIRITLIDVGRRPQNYYTMTLLSFEWIFTEHKNHLNLLTFQLQSNTGKRELNFENYEFSQTTLEHVFFKIAKDQEQEQETQED